MESNFRLWEFALLLLLTVSLGTFTLRNTRNLISFFLIIWYLCYFFLIFYIFVFFGLFALLCFSRSANTMISFKYHFYLSCCDHLTPPPRWLYWYWVRLIFAILRRERISSMDQSLAFCLFLSGVEQFLFAGSFGIFFKVNLFDLPIWL